MLYYDTHIGCWRFSGDIVEINEDEEKRRDSEEYRSGKGGGKEGNFQEQGKLYDGRGVLEVVHT